MIAVHSIHKYGEGLSPEVMEGLAVNGCSLVAVSSEKEHGESARRNRWKNWTNAIKHASYHKGVFFGMDSDIVLVPCAPDIALSTIKDYDIIIWKTSKNNMSHGFWGVKKKVVESIPMYWSGDNFCPICSWFAAATAAGYKITYIDDPVLKHLKRR